MVEQSKDSNIHGLSAINGSGMAQRKLQHRLYAKFADSGRVIPNKVRRLRVNI
jgi:hypothetical protein